MKHITTDPLARTDNQASDLVAGVDFNESTKEYTLYSYISVFCTVLWNGRCLNVFGCSLLCRICKKRQSCNRTGVGNGEGKKICSRLWFGIIACVYYCF